MGKQKGFDAFVKSLLVAPKPSEEKKGKKRSNSKNEQSGGAIGNVEKYKSESLGDAGLLQMLSEGTTTNVLDGSQQADISSMGDRVRGVGLGFENQTNQGQSQLLAEAQRMKKKAMAGNEQKNKEVDKPKQAPANMKASKAAIDKKETVDYRSQLIAEKRAKKAQKHQ